MISTAADAREYETITEAARRHRVSTKTIRRRIADGYLIGYRFGPTLIRLCPDEVDAALSPIPTIGAVS
jgi:excisionase family DNA binding protein